MDRRVEAYDLRCHEGCDGIDLRDDLLNRSHRLTRALPLTSLPGDPQPGDQGG